jgi:chromosome segregation ATPase
MNQIPVWQRILSRFETVEEFDKYLSEYAEVTGILNARKEEVKSYELRLAQLQSQVETLEKQKAKIEAAIDSLKVAGVKELKALSEATEKQLKTVAATAIRETQTTGQAVVNRLEAIRREAEAEVGGYLNRFDEVVQKAYEAGVIVGQAEERLSQLQAVKQVIVSHQAGREEG